MMNSLDIVNPAWNAATQNDSHLFPSLNLLFLLAFSDLDQILIEETLAFPHFFNTLKPLVLSVFLREVTERGPENHNFNRNKDWIVKMDVKWSNTTSKC